MRLLLLLLGTETLRRHWAWFAGLGLVWLAAGIFIFVDALDGMLYFPLRPFGWLLVAEGSLSVLLALTRIAVHPPLRLARGLLVLLAGLLIVSPWHLHDFILALVFGLFLLADGVFRIASAWVVRFPGWRLALAGGVAEFLLGVFVLEPYPTWYAGTVPGCIGIALALTGRSALLVGWRLYRLPPHASLGMLYARGHFLQRSQLELERQRVDRPSGDVLTVHVWTATGTASDPVRRPLVDRYIAAVDKKGVISTGHAALELPPDIYISHYPAVEIDHSPTDFTRMLRATSENDMPGRFQPSYREEAAEWCESTEKIRFRRFDGERVRRFWEMYRQDATYNLTNRNCSSVVAQALEIGLEGTLARSRRGLGHVLRILFSTEFWAANIVRKHAESMAWTPGFVLDYARNLRALENPPPLSLRGMLAAMRSNWRHRQVLKRRQQRGRALA
ncbi:HdeD family acid-resistance protein [Geminicoccus flavidas]|uniref:HdeD family acid-resistance protein n=1 Tax=Geminicoccus flavidas TaxID=2506407 RepID=UPI00135866B0|nr:hypothetical protein [Geminicoccus flavidas]